MSENSRTAEIGPSVVIERIPIKDTSSPADQKAIKAINAFDATVIEINNIANNTSGLPELHKRKKEPFLSKVKSLLTGKPTS